MSAKRTKMNQVDFGVAWIVDKQSETDGLVEVDSQTITPEFVVYEGIDGNTYESVTSDEWEALSGYTGQYSYNGPIMHPSEYLGGGMESGLLTRPGTYVTVSVDDLDTSPDEDSTVGWAVLRQKD